jgi:hypothetical protein
MTEDTVCPHFSQKKAVHQNYLTQHNIHFCATDTKKVLYEKIKQKKRPETLNRSRQSNPHFAYLHAKKAIVWLCPRVFLGHQTHHSEATYNLCSDFG